MNSLHVLDTVWLNVAGMPATIKRLLVLVATVLATGTTSGDRTSSISDDMESPLDRIPQARPLSTFGTYLPQKG